MLVGRQANNNLNYTNIDSTFNSSESTLSKTYALSNSPWGANYRSPYMYQAYQEQVDFYAMMGRNFDQIDTNRDGLASASEIMALAARSGNTTSIEASDFTPGTAPADMTPVPVGIHAQTGAILFNATANLQGGSLAPTPSLNKAYFENRSQDILLWQNYNKFLYSIGVTFDHWDTNRDGRLSKAELDAVAARSGDPTRIEKSDLLGASTTQTNNTGFIQFNPANVGTDQFGQVQISGISLGANQLTTTLIGQYNATPWQESQNITNMYSTLFQNFSQVDTNNDGVLSRAELSAFTAKSGDTTKLEVTDFTPGTVTQTFTGVTISSSNDGLISINGAPMFGTDFQITRTNLQQRLSESENGTNFRKIMYNLGQVTNRVDTNGDGTLSLAELNAFKARAGDITKLDFADFA